MKFRPILLACFLSLPGGLLFSQISGQVTDETGQPMPFASVFFKNTTIGTTTNEQGFYRLDPGPGSHLLVFQYIGFQQKTRDVFLLSGEKRTLNVQLQPADFSLAEVIIRPGNDEDPAYPIMREAIARRAGHRKMLGDHVCDAYVKGFHKLGDAPKKILGKDIGDMGGILDSTRQGVLYLSESVSRKWVNGQPPVIREEMLRSRVSGSENGFSINRASLTDLSLYDERVEVMNLLNSPLADNAFSFYRFRLVGTSDDGKGHRIHKIELLPKRPAEAVFSGFIFIVNGFYCLSATDLLILGKNLNQDVLDTLRIRQEYVPLENAGSGRWAMLSQTLDFKFGLLGFKIHGNFLILLSNYLFGENARPDFLKNEVFRVKNEANKRDTAWWNTARPVPLTAEERLDYQKKDSLAVIWKSPAYLDSLDRKNNRFVLSNLLFGYTWRNSQKRISLGFDSPLLTAQFNAVQGLNLSLPVRFGKWLDEERTRSLSISPAISYGFSEKKARADVSVRQQFNAINYATVRLAGGIRLQQFDRSNPISPILNTSWTLYARQNWMSIFEKRYLAAAWEQEIANGLRLESNLEFADRRPLENTTDYSIRGNKDLPIPPNFPIQLADTISNFTAHTALVAEARLRIRIGQHFETYPNRRELGSSRWPDIWLRYKKGIATRDGQPDFDQAEIRFSENGRSVGSLGRLEWDVRMGTFFRKKNVQLPDFQSFAGNELWLDRPGRYLNSFRILNYYRTSGTGPYAEAHAQWHLGGWLFDKLPGIRRLNFEEVVSFNFLKTEAWNYQPNPLGLSFSPHVEAGFGVENIGWKAFRLLRVDLFAGWSGPQFDGLRLILGVNL